ARNVAEPELDQGESQQILRILGRQRIGALKQRKRPGQIRGQNERALMPERGGGGARGTLGVGTLCFSNFGQDLRGGRNVPRCELGERPAPPAWGPRLGGA